MTTRSRATNPAQKTSQKASSSKKTTSKTSTKKITAPVVLKPQGVTKKRPARRPAVSETPSRDVTSKTSASGVSTGTVSPFVVEEAPSSSHRTPLNQQIAALVKDYEANTPRSKSHHASYRSKSHRRSHHRFKSHHESRHRFKSHHRRHDLFLEFSKFFSSDSKAENGSRVSFLHEEDNKFFLKLHKRFRIVDIKYFKQIFYETFKLKNLIKLIHDYIDWTWSIKNDKNKKNKNT